MFSIKDRDDLRQHVLQLAANDQRVVAGAVVGSLALEEGDRWSDLDLTFAVADEFQLMDVLQDWTRELAGTRAAVQLFDLPSGPSLYRVFLLPGCLQFDLSFTPASSFGATGPKFRILFGSAVPRVHVQPPPASELFGHAVHHALRARFCIERGRYWQAEYWISGVRDFALNLACRRRGLPAQHGRGYDQLPAKVLDSFESSLVRALERKELLRALRAALAGLFRESQDAGDLAAQVAARLQELTAEWSESAVQEGSH